MASREGKPGDDVARRFDDPTRIDDPTRAVQRAAAEELADKERRPFVLMVSGPHLGELFAVPVGAGEGLLVGRDPNAGVRLGDDESVSRKHAVITADEHSVSVRDLGSQNGTFIDGKRVESAPLHEGQKIRVGQTVVLKFVRLDTVEEGAQRQLLDAALRDGATRVFNRRYFMSRLAAEIGFADRHRHALSLVLFDIDRFREVNEKVGRERADSALAQLCALVQASVRNEDVVARHGGEEIIVLLRATPVEAAARTAERVRKKVAGADLGVGQPLSISAGVVSYPLTPDTPMASSAIVDILIERVEGALQRAKLAGRNQVAR